MAKHILAKYTFDEIVEGLDIAVNQGYIDVKFKDNLTLYNYNNKCTYDKAWNDFTLSSRGLVLCIDQKKIVALPFAKFFNFGENGYILPDEDYTTTDKLDGSLGILYYWNNKWNVCTRGSFDSPQAKWAENWLSQSTLNRINDQSYKNKTLLTEIIYPENRIVVNYNGWSGLVFLSSYDLNTFDEDLYGEGFTQLRHIPNKGDKSSVFFDGKIETIQSLLHKCKNLPSTQEGFVVRFESGLRIKLKGAEYCRIHKIISNITPISIWDSMRMCDDLDKIKLDIPEEFYIEFDNIRNNLQDKFDRLILFLSLIHDSTHHMNDKELGLYIQNQSDDKLKFLFQVRKNNLLSEYKYPGKARDSLFKTFRPDGNNLNA